MSFRPNGGELTDDGKGVLDAARRAGYELVNEGAMNPGIPEAVSRPLISGAELMRRFNQAV
jgi:hypothetical protein